MPAIGITGGIATGKTTFCEFLKEFLPDAAFFNADRAARELSDHDAEVREEITREFGPGVYSTDGHLNRAEVRATILQSAARKRALEQILHPRIRRQWSAEAQTYRHAPGFFFADIPLLYETEGDALCDAVAVVACSPQVQLERLRQRGSVRQGEAAGIIESQMPLAEKIKRADHVVWNNGDRAALREQTRLLVELWRK